MGNSWLHCNSSTLRARQKQSYRIYTTKSLVLNAGRPLKRCLEKKATEKTQTERARAHFMKQNLLRLQNQRN